MLYVPRICLADVGRVPLGVSLFSIGLKKKKKSQSKLIVLFFFSFFFSFRLGGGWAGTGFFMDPMSGIAAVFGVQVIASTRDVEIFKVPIKLEAVLYQGLKVAV